MQIRISLKPALAALKPMPELSYPCDGQPNDWDEAILKLPARRTAINTLISQLSSFSARPWPHQSNLVGDVVWRKLGAIKDRARERVDEELQHLHRRLPRNDRRQRSNPLAQASAVGRQTLSIVDQVATPRRRTLTISRRTNLSHAQTS